MESLRNRESEEKKCILSRPVSPREITNFPWGNKGKTYLMSWHRRCKYLLCCSPSACSFSVGQEVFIAFVVLHLDGRPMSDLLAVLCRDRTWVCITSYLWGNFDFHREISQAKWDKPPKQVSLRAPQTLQKRIRRMETRNVPEITWGQCSIALRQRSPWLLAGFPEDAFIYDAEKEQWTWKWDRQCWQLNHASGSPTEERIGGINCIQ